ncbi:hypothetical protein [Thomasclavelia cocleata]|uniref:hypothetical protein n=1 Tax=Thomasclavelia cocleata TaxID=69824 RepID=UPI00256F032C|nr:hypothetical protein [Thomasclavelia cocleata]
MTILEKTPITEFHAGAALLVLVLCFVLGLIIGGVYTYYKRDCNYLLLGLGLGIVAGLYIGYFVGDEMQKETGNYFYEVEIDNSILLSDFIKKYEIVEIKSDNILVIKEINNDANKNKVKDSEVNLKEEDI